MEKKVFVMGDTFSMDALNQLLHVLLCFLLFLLTVCLGLAILYRRATMVRRSKSHVLIYGGGNRSSPWLPFRVMLCCEAGPMVMTNMFWHHHTVDAIQGGRARYIRTT